MRRQIIILLALLMLVLPAAAQEWPDSFIGDQMHFAESQPVQIYLLSWHDRNPWGMIDMTGAFFYFGSLAFGYGNEENVAILDFDTFAMRRCPEPVFGTPAPPQCYYYAPRLIGLSYTLTWNEEAGSYLVLGDGYWGTNVIALVLNESSDSGVILMGTMNLSDSGVMVWDDNVTHYTYIFEPKTALPRGFMRRGLGRRIGVE